MKHFFKILVTIFFFQSALAQTPDTTHWWHDKIRTLRYHPEGNDIVIINGERRFTRALYGTNTAFRVEAGDLPELALYMPGMGGNFKFGILSGDSSKWLIKADTIIARYRAGSMLYEIKDRMLGSGKLYITILPMADAEGMIIRVNGREMDPAVKLLWAFGGASGKKFSRDGDMGPDPESSFYLKPENCTDNNYRITANTFLLKYGTGVVAEWDPYVNKNLPSDTVAAVKIGKEQQLTGILPPASSMHIVDASAQTSPLALYRSGKSKTPVVTGALGLRNNEPVFFAVQKPDSGKLLTYEMLIDVYTRAESARKKMADRVIIKTPDPFINTLGGVLSIAADAVWETPTFLHGAIGWRMRLNGWRGPYVGDVLGWHDRAKTHFKAYALSQVTTPLKGPVIMDTALHLARSLEKMGTSIFSSGYISRNPNGDFRPHHYDMNLVYIDALLRHFEWTGDLALAKELWPVITRHLDWEKRNFDPDNDGLYDAYAAIWASDALQYSGGSVTHSSAYNYKANKEAAVIAKLIGEDPAPYEKEAEKILQAINNILWMPGNGTYAEFKDLLGNKLLHPNAAIWTLYHALDSDVPDPFQAYQSMQYIDENIPHIPVRAKGIEEGFSTISTSKWMPYDWSLNNVATAEVMHTALANWQAGRNEKAFKLWKSELLSTMYLGGSPGNIGQISFYDAARGEAYRDFADPVAMTARSLVEGLFGIQPHALSGELLIRPGFPSAWKNASISLPDITVDFKRNGKEDSYTIIPVFSTKLKLKLEIRANGTKIQSLTVNGKKAEWKNGNEAIEFPVIEINAGVEDKYEIKINWLGDKSNPTGNKQKYCNGDKLDISFPGSLVQSIADPQQVLQQVKTNAGKLTAVVSASRSKHLFFVQLKQNDFIYWEPISLDIREPVEITAPFKQSRNDLQFSLFNNMNTLLKGNLVINPGPHALTRPLELKPQSIFTQLHTGSDNLVPGSNRISFVWEGGSAQQDIVSWNISQPQKKSQQVNMDALFNDKVTSIFTNQYLSPRPTVSTLQLPTQGIGDWTHPLKTAEINDKGLRKLAGEKNLFNIPQGISFATPSDTLKRNILFTSQWDNYPKQVSIPLSGQSSHAYLLMAGSTNPMQSRLVNGAVWVLYTDGTADTLLLKNPETWWPIEQDYLDDGFAFTIDAARPVRVHLKTGKIVSDLDGSAVTSNGKAIDGGAATVLDMPLNATKTLKELKLQSIANDVVIGLMAITLTRE